MKNNEQNQFIERIEVLKPIVEILRILNNNENEMTCFYQHFGVKEEEIKDHKTLEKKLAEILVDLELSAMGNLEEDPLHVDRNARLERYLGFGLYDCLSYESGEQKVKTTIDGIPRVLKNMTQYTNYQYEECLRKIADKYFEHATGLLRLSKSKKETSDYEYDEKEKVALSNINEAISIYKRLGKEQEGIEKGGDVCYKAGDYFLALHYYEKARRPNKIKEVLKKVPEIQKKGAE